LDRAVGSNDVEQAAVVDPYNHLFFMQVDAV
jgi:hypothetical protein